MFVSLAIAFDSKCHYVDYFHYEICRTCVQKGADARAVDHEGHDPLYYAKVSDATDAAMCAQLLQTSRGCRESFIT